MPTVKNFSELENAMMQTIKNKYPEAIKVCCQKWYKEHSKMQDIISEEEFLAKANESLKMTNENGKFQSVFKIKWDEDIYNANREILDDLKADFESNEMVNEIMDFIFGKK